VNHKKYAGKAIIPNCTGVAKAVGLVFQDALLFPHDEQDVADPQRVVHLRATEESQTHV
jgi:ABC-type sulfate/molybdate transport systems ATPase subunit